MLKCCGLPESPDFQNKVCPNCSLVLHEVCFLRGKHKCTESWKIKISFLEGLQISRELMDHMEQSELCESSEIAKKKQKIESQECNQSQSQNDQKSQNSNSKQVPSSIDFSNYFFFQFDLSPCNEGISPLLNKTNQILNKSNLSQSQQETFLNWKIEAEKKHELNKTILSEKDCLSQYWFELFLLHLKLAWLENNKDRVEIGKQQEEIFRKISQGLENKISQANNNQKNQAYEYMCKQINQVLLSQPNIRQGFIQNKITIPKLISQINSRPISLLARRQSDIKTKNDSQQQEDKEANTESKFEACKEKQGSNVRRAKIIDNQQESTNQSQNGSSSTPQSCDRQYTLYFPPHPQTPLSQNEEDIELYMQLQQDGDCRAVQIKIQQNLKKIYEKNKNLLLQEIDKTMLQRDQIKSSSQL